MGGGGLNECRFYWDGRMRRKNIRLELEGETGRETRVF